MLIDCAEHPESELLIVEGKSAANALKRVRDRRSQAVLALQGKIPNAAKAKSVRKLFQNPQIASLFEALGADFSGDVRMDQLRYQKLVILTDPDADGIHTRVLIAVLFFLHLRAVVEQQRLFIGYAPLFSVGSAQLKTPAVAFTQNQYAQVLEDLQAKGITDTVTTRYKGLAGMDQPMLSRYCVDTESRVIKRVTVTDCKAMLQAFGL